MTTNRFILCVSITFGLAYAALGLTRHWRFESSYDLAIFDQAIWHLSRFGAPASSIRGYSNLLGDHFSPILATLAPLYWIAAAPESLIAAQAALLAISIAPVYLFCRSRVPPAAAAMLSVSYGLFWGMQRAAAFDVHETAFAPLAVSGLILAMDRRRWWWFTVAAVALVLTKEDLIPLLVFVAIYLLARDERRAGWILLASSLAVFAVVIGVVIPAAGNGAYGYAGAYADALRDLRRIPIMLVAPPVKLLTAFMWVAPFALLPLASPLCTWLLPFAAERFLSSNSLHWGTLFHYSAPLAPIVAMAAADGLARLARAIDNDVMRRRFTTAAAAMTIVLAAALPGHQPLLQLLSPAFYALPLGDPTGDRAVATIPADASVTAQAAIAPHLAHRDNIRILEAGAPDLEYVIASGNASPWPAATVGEIAAFLRDRLSRGYVIVFDDAGWVVLRHESATRYARSSLLSRFANGTRIGEQERVQ